MLQRLALLFCLLLLSLLGSSVASSSSAAGYDEELAKRLLLYSSIAMAAPEEVTSWTFPNPTCNELTKDDEIDEAYRAKDTAFGFIVVNHVDAFIIATFKASNDTRDWIQHDFHTLPFAYRHKCVIEGVSLPGHVHHGFCSYYSELAALGMGDRIAELHRKLGYPVLISGHSLGAAAAVVCAADLMTRFNLEPEIVLTFGQPRVGDAAFVAPLVRTGKAFRVVHRRDCVPHLTPCCGFPGACRNDTACPYHHGTEVWYNNDMTVPGAYKMCHEGESQKCSDGVVAVSTWDHDVYFNLNVAHFCRVGGDAAEESGALMR